MGKKQAGFYPSPITFPFPFLAPLADEEGDGDEAEEKEHGGDAEHGDEFASACVFHIHNRSPAL
ncbi:MAG TPA: hypothetical protein VG148_01035, partial [Pyrinomonadaceae bacterium]|nr:hypothetical protein [Pyrinomonadaceae bacterium]